MEKYGKKLTTSIEPYRLHRNMLLDMEVQITKMRYEYPPGKPSSIYHMMSCVKGLLHSVSSKIVEDYINEN